jgi:hypothetical protein
MNRNDFLSMLENKVQLNRQMIGEVYELIDIFPYFQSAHMLLLKGLQMNGDIKFEKQLRNSSLHIADREVLYYLLNRKTEVTVVEEESVHEEAAFEGHGFDHQQTVIESAKNSEQLISEIEKDSGIEAANSEDPLHLHSHSILISSQTETRESEEVMFVMDEETTPDEDRIFYMDPGFSVPDQTDLLELETDMAKVVPEELIHDQQEEPVADPGRNKKLVQSDLIDKFILANPRIEPVRDPSKVSYEDISKPIIEKDGGFVTETLARIYVNQGYYSKAIDIYKELCLKFPEKSSYFATQIELVKVYLKK